MKNFIIGLCVLMGILTSCSSDEEKDASLYFVGDSMVANWDIEASFPNYATKNWGVDGIGVEYIKSMKVADTNAEVVILIGVNDIGKVMNENDAELYCAQYMNIIKNIGGIRIVLLSILPTSDKEKNITIKKVNDKIKFLSQAYTYIKYVDCYGDFLNSKGILREDWTREGLHLNDYGYIRLTDIVKKNL